MKIKRIFLVSVSIFLLCAMTLNLVSCASETNVTHETNEKINTDTEKKSNDEAPHSSPSTNLSDDVVPGGVGPFVTSSSQNGLVTDFALRLFKASEDPENSTLISPLSVLYALAMTQNGARGETLRQMEEVLGMPKDEMNRYLCSYVSKLPQGEKCTLSLANAIWFNDIADFTVNDDFLQTNADYYSADIYKSRFSDQTVKDINAWVNENTDGMIPDILDRVNENSVMYLLNALAFDAEWYDVYCDFQIEKGTFTTEDGKTEDAEYMNGSEGTYLEDENAVGFMKYYKGKSFQDKSYAFVALLPNEGMSVHDYVASLDGEKLSSMLASPEMCPVITKIPKFESEYKADMSDALKSMGIIDAFKLKKADFSGLGSVEVSELSAENAYIYIDQVIHKTFISVGERGTKAGAATIVEMVAGCTMDAPNPQKPKEIYLDRPFVYMIVDCENKVPLFIGTMMSLSE